MSKKVLVTGGAGFIGSHLVEALVDKGYKVRVVDNLISGKRDRLKPEAEFIEGDIANPDICNKAMDGMEGVFHLAAMSHVDSSIASVDVCTRSNILGTQNLLLAAQKQGVSKFVYSGSSTFYGNRPVPHREYETPSEILNFYGLSKQVGEKYCEMFDQIFNVPTIILRYFNVYGPRQSHTGAYAMVLGIFLAQNKNNQPLTIHGDGTQRRDFVHVRDVVNANIMAFESKLRNKVFNVGTGSDISIKEIANMISPNQKQIERRAGDSNASRADITRITTELGWVPKVRFSDGFEEMKDRTYRGLE